MALGDIQKRQEEEVLDIKGSFILNPISAIFDSDLAAKSPRAGSLKLLMAGIVAL